VDILGGEAFRRRSPRFWLRCALKGEVLSELVGLRAPCAKAAEEVEAAGHSSIRADRRRRLLDIQHLDDCGVRYRRRRRPRGQAR